MDRKSFAQKLTMLGICPFMIRNMTGTINGTTSTHDDDIKIIKSQKQFIENWLSDLLDSMDKHLDKSSENAGWPVLSSIRQSVKPLIALS